MNADSRHIELAAIPGLPGMLLKAATTRKAAQGDPVFQALRISARGIAADAAKLEKFRAVCAFGDDPQLPLTYPHIMAFALHMQLMLEPEFPFTPMGAVHVRNRIRQERPLLQNEALDFVAYVSGAEHVEKGYEVSIVTEVESGGEPVWEDLSVMLIRQGGTGEKRARSTPLPPMTFTDSVQWELAANKGRQYAAASGDYNPIHLYPLTAKMMGFRRQIMHGMWSKSRCVAQLLAADYGGPATVDVSFKLPIFLPSNVQLQYSADTQGAQFELRDAAGEKPHLAGTLTYS